MAYPVQNMQGRAMALKRKWASRDKKLKEWYKMLKLTDEMKEDNKESFTSNSPRTFYNLSKHLLTPNYIPHKFDKDDFSPLAVDAATLFEADIEKQGWERLEKVYRKSGRQSFIDKLASYILATGWYAVQAYSDDHGFHADLWHPAQVYPEFSPDPEVGLLEVAHIYKVSTQSAQRKAMLQGWNLSYGQETMTTIIDYWFYDELGQVSHTIMVGNNYVVEPYIDTRFTEIPVIVGPVGGLPDDGTLDNKWQENHGEALVAVNEGIYKNSDRLSSFLQQAVRDATEPKWLELSQGGQILTPEKFKAGGIFRGDPGDVVVALVPPPIPVELQQRIFDYEQKKQEASFSPLMFGSIQFQVAAYTLSQMAQAAQQVLRPYHEAMMTVLSGIDNKWLEGMRIHGYTPRGVTIPKDLPKDAEMEVTYPISIPGDLINRITVAKMMNPELRFSFDYIFENLFPEVRDTMGEIAKSRKDMALNSEIGITIASIVAFRASAREASIRGNDEMAEVYEAAADFLFSQMKPQEQLPPAPGGEAPIPQQNIPRTPTREA